MTNSNLVPITSLDIKPGDCFYAEYWSTGGKYTHKIVIEYIEKDHIAFLRPLSWGGGSETYRIWDMNTILVDPESKKVVGSYTKEYTDLEVRRKELEEIQRHYWYVIRDMEKRFGPVSEKPDIVKKLEDRKRELANEEEALYPEMTRIINLGYADESPGAHQDSDS